MAVQIGRRNGMVLSQLAIGVRDIYISHVQRSKTFICHSMSPRVILYRLSNEFIEKYIMAGRVLTESESEEDNMNLNLLEPVVEISDKPRNNSRKRKGKGNCLEPKRKGKQQTKKPKNTNHINTVKENEFVSVSVKEEPAEHMPVEEMPQSVQMATIPINNNSATLPVYVYVQQPQPGTEYSDQKALNQPESTDSPSTSTNTDSIQEEITVKQEPEEVENVFVMPFGADDQINLTPTSTKTEVEVVENDSPAEIANKDRNVAIMRNIQPMVSQSSSVKIKNLTYRLVELNNRNLKCNTRIEKIKEECKKRLGVVRSEKREIETEIDKVLNIIKKLKEEESKK